MDWLRARLRKRLGLHRPDRGLGFAFVSFNRGRLAAATGGIAMAVLVMFVELGLLQAILGSQAALAGLIDGDLVIMNSARTNLHEWTRIPRIRLAEAAAVPGVDTVSGVYESGMLLRNPPARAVHRIIAFAMNGEAQPLKVGDRDAVRAALSRPNAVLFDRRSRDIYGAIAPGRIIELNGQPFNVAGLADIGPDIVMDGAVVLRDGAWLSADPNAQPVMGVLRLTPDADLEAVRAGLKQALPADVAVMTPGEIWWREIVFTFRSVPIGIIFGAGVATGAFIGAIICYQILFNEVVDLRKELSTLRAMGYGPGFFRRLILEEAYLLAACGFAIGLVGAIFTYRILAGATGLAVQMHPGAALFVALATGAMTHLGGNFAIRHLASFEPAELY
jgi:putative ABC transport system permease protein